MKKLKIGELVYSKKYGQGIVTDILDFGYYRVTIVHDGKYIPTFKRDELFAKDDLVRIRKTANSFGAKMFSHIDIRTFLNYAPQCKKHKYVVSHPVDGGHYTIHSYTYVYDIVHHIKPEYYYVGDEDASPELQEITNRLCETLTIGKQTAEELSESLKLPCKKDSEKEIMFKTIELMESESKADTIIKLKCAGFKIDTIEKIIRSLYK